MHADSPAGMTGPHDTDTKWLIKVSISFRVLSFGGGTANGWSALYAPDGMLFRHCSMMRRLWRISSILTKQRS